LKTPPGFVHTTRNILLDDIGSNLDPDRFMVTKTPLNRGRTRINVYADEDVDINYIDLDVDSRYPVKTTIFGRKPEKKGTPWVEWLGISFLALLLAFSLGGEDCDDCDV